MWHFGPGTVSAEARIACDGKLRQRDALQYAAQVHIYGKTEGQQLVRQLGNEGSARHTGPGTLLNLSNSDGATIAQLHTTPVVGCRSPVKPDTAKRRARFAGHPTSRPTLQMGQPGATRPLLWLTKHTAARSDGSCHLEWRSALAQSPGSPGFSMHKMVRSRPHLLAAQPHCSQRGGGAMGLPATSQAATAHRRPRRL